MLGQICDSESCAHILYCCQFVSNCLLFIGAAANSP